MIALIGVLSAVLTSSCWTPQLQRTLRQGTASDFAWPYLVTLVVGDGSWTACGLLRGDRSSWCPTSRSSGEP